MNYVTIYLVILYVRNCLPIEGILNMIVLTSICKVENIERSNVFTVLTFPLLCIFSLQRTQILPINYKIDSI